MFGKKLFIHIPKNGGMSIRHRDSKFRKHIIWPTPPIIGDETYRRMFTHKMKTMGRPNTPWEHARWRDVDSRVAIMHDAFAIVRNPWDRVVSRYTFATNNDNTWDDVIVKGKKTGGKNMTFDEFLEQRFQYDDKACGVDSKYTWHLAIRGWWNAFDYVSDQRGNNRCHIMRFEHYQEDVNKYFSMPNEMIDIRNVSRGEKSADLKRVSGRKSYTEFYNKEQIQIVADWYAKDIEYWGFDFDTPATRNYWNIQ